MWFVIEHFARLDEVLRRVAYLLKPGGIFCFSTPNERGVSGRSAFRNFLRRSPRDHHTIWSPGSAEKVLRRYGFRIEKMRSTGHHPERVPFVPAGGPIFHIAMGLSKMLHMGDSFEIYARKVGGES
jgi:SAM-dependent methyltransferase